MGKVKFIIRRGISDNASRELIIDEQSLNFENKDIVNNTFTTFAKDEIAGYRYGIKWLTLRITFGRDYQIFIKNKKGEILKINFKTYFGRKKNSYHKQYSEILNALWDCYFRDIANDFIEKFKNGEEFKIDKVLISTKGITINNFKTEIPWEKVRTKNYYRNFSIYSIDNPSKMNYGYAYLDDWNTSVLYSVVRTILKQKNIEVY